MKHLQQNYRYLLLSISLVFLPVLLAIVGLFIDFLLDRQVFPALATRYLPVYFALGALVFWTLRTTRNETFVLFNNEVRASFAIRASWNITAIILSLVLVSIMFWPVTNWSTHLYGGNGDGYNWRWITWRMSQEFRNGNFFPTRFDDIVAPYGVNLRLTDGYLSMYIGGFFNLVVGPTLAYNLTLVSSVFFNFFSAKRLSFTIGNSQMVSLLCGIVMATAPSITLRQLGHLNLCFSFVMCLAAIEGVKLLRTETIRVWQPVLVLTLSFFSSFYFFVLSMLFYVACVLVRLVKSPVVDRFSLRTKLARFSLVAISVIVVISPFIVTRLHHENAEHLAGAPPATARTDEYMYYSSDPRMFFLPASDALVQIPKANEVRRNTSPNVVENTPFPGYVVLIATGLVIVLVRKWRWLIATFWTVFTILSLGPTLIWGSDTRYPYFFPRSLLDTSTSDPIGWLPYSNLTLIPGMTALRTPNRFAMILPVIGVIAISILAKEMIKNRWNLKLRLPAALGVVLLIIPNFRTSNYWYDTGFSAPVSAALNSIRSDSSSLRVLVAGQNCIQTIQFANLQVKHRHPIVGCQTFSAAVPWYSSLHDYRNSSALAAVQCDPNTFGLAPMNPANKPIPASDVLQVLRSTLRVGYVVLPKQFGCQDEMRTKVIVEVLRTSNKVLVDSVDYLIVAT